MAHLDIIIPVHNEEKAIVTFHNRLSLALLKSGEPCQIIYINDGSTDSSASLLDNLAHVPSHPPIQVLHLDKNRGYGAALKIGIRWGQSPLIAIIDCDETYDPAELIALLQYMDKSDMVVGTRPAEKGLRYVVKGFLKHLASYAVAYPIPDLNSGLRIFRRDLFRSVENLLPNGFSFTSTITMGALNRPSIVRFVPITYATRVGTSKIKPVRSAWFFLLLILRTMILFNPLKFFLPASAALMAIGIGFLVRDLLARNLAQTSLLMLVNGFILLAIGLLAEAIRSK